jgi:hypothetical protein
MVILLIRLIAITLPDRLYAGRYIVVPHTSQAGTTYYSKIILLTLSQQMSEQLVLNFTSFILPYMHGLHIHKSE